MMKIFFAAIALQIILVTSSFAQTGAVENPTGVDQKPAATNAAKQPPRGEESSANAALRTALTRDKDRGVRKKAAMSLGNMKAADEKTLKALIRQLNDADPAVRKTSYDALKKIGKPAILPLTVALKHRRPIVRRAAAQLLGELSTSAVAAGNNGSTSSTNNKSKVTASAAPPKT